MQLKDVMSTEVYLGDPDMPLREVAALMRDGDFGLVPVGENDRLVGTITDRDIAIRAVAEGKDPNATLVREVMSNGIKFCFEDDSVEDAAVIMGREQIRRLPVVNRDKRLVGIVSLGDLAIDSRSIRQAAVALANVSQP